VTVSQNNVDAANRILFAVAQRELEALLAMADPEVRWQSFFAALSEDGEYHGHDGLRKYMSDLHETFEYLHPEVRDMLDADNLVVGLGTIRYRGKGSGVETDASAGWVFKFRAGKLLQFRAFRDPGQALERVGLDDV
jgi:ketosteroid isomerase-like protein